MWLRGVPPPSEMPRNAAPLAWWVASAVDDARACAHAFGLCMYDVIFYVYVTRPLSLGWPQQSAGITNSFHEPHD